MSKKILIYIMNPSGFIAALSAVKTLHDINSISVFSVVEWPGSNQVSKEIFDIIKSFSKKFSFIKKNMLKSQISWKKIKFDEIFFPHNLMEETCEPLFRAYPRAKRICYGDAFGMVFNKESFLANSKTVSKKGILGQVKSIIGWIFLPKKNINYDYEADRAALILPVDQFGIYFKNVPLTVCPKNNVLEVIAHCRLACQGLNHYITKILKLYSHKKIFLFLTENFAEAGSITPEQEINMYCTILKKYCHRGDIILLKSHPGETLDKNKKIKDKLAHKLQVIELDKKFKRYPIEIWQSLLKNCQTISVAYPTLSLKYLYNIDVIQPMDNKLIERWFLKQSWNEMKNAIQLYMLPLEKIKSWDHKSDLWSS